jgi:hypothetical protein
MRNRLFIGLGAGVVAVLSACTVTNANPYPDPPSFCAAKAKAECQIAAACSISASDCTTFRTQVCLGEVSPAPPNLDGQAAAAGMRKYDSSKAQACIDALNGAYNANTSKVAFTALFGSGSITDKCERVFSGAAGQDQVCTSDYDCANSAICVPDPPGSMTLGCAQPVQPQNGYCATPGTQCPMDQFCPVGGTGSPKCQPSAVSGQACDANTPCISTQRCVGGMCAARAALGDGCASNDDCSPDAPYCDLYATPAPRCAVGQTFAGGAYDCNEFASTGQPQPDAGGGDSGGNDSGGGDSGGTDSGGSDAGGD